MKAKSNSSDRNSAKNQTWHSIGGGSGIIAVLKKIVIRVPSARHLANLRIPTELGIVSFKCPKPIGTQRIAPHLFSLTAPIFPLIQTLPEFPVPLFRVLHQPENHVLGKLH